MVPAWQQIFWVALGSVTGGLARWGVGLLGARWLTTPGFPWATFFINIGGSFVLGALLTMLAERQFLGTISWLNADQLRLAIGVGFCGSYTTFSTYEYESFKLLEGAHAALGLLYLIGSVAAGLLAVWLGAQLVRLL